MRIRLLIIGVVLTLLYTVVIAHTLAGEPTHGFSYFGDLKYPEGFPHFDYANPHAPKGGKMRTSVIGTFNNLHPYMDKGVSAAGIDMIYDYLTTQSEDELSSAYGRLAEGVELADDYSWAAFTLRENAYWHDGVPLTIEDVIWTFNTIKTRGSVGWKSAYKNIVSVERVGPRTFRFHFSENAPNTPQLSMLISSFRPLPKHYWKDKTFNVTTLVPPLGSGPYRIKSVDAGHRIVYERVEDYWGKDLNVNIGYYNFDEIQFIYFLDKNLVLQALKAHLFDYKREFNTEDYATAYDFWGFRKGLFTRERIQLKIAFGMDWGIAFNARKEKLKDIRVREALTLAYNFEWSNRVLWRDAKERNTSYFIGSGLAVAGMASDAELALLEPFRGQIPERVFTHAFTLPVNNPYGRNRDTLLQADALLRGAGWIVRDFRRVNRESGEPFTLEFLANSVVQERMLAPYVENLKRLGITAKLRRVESSQAINRMRKYDFEVTVRQYWLSNIPPAWRIRSFYRSDNADRPNMLNYVGIKEPAVDFLIEKIIYAGSEEEMNVAGHALDRILLWNFYMVPGGYPRGRSFVYWDRFGFPPPESMKWNGWPHLWWLDKEKSNRVDAGIAALAQN